MDVEFKTTAFKNVFADSAKFGVLFGNKCYIGFKVYIHDVHKLKYDILNILTNIK